MYMHRARQLLMLTHVLTLWRREDLGGRVLAFAPD